MGRICMMAAVMLVASVLLVPAHRASASVPTGRGAATDSPDPGDGAVTVDQALQTAAATGKPVDVPSYTTSTDSLQARPNGQLALTQALAPVRKNVDGTWLALDPTLHQSADGSWSPAVVPGGLRLSGGGDGPLVTMYSGESSLALSLPIRLPSPTVSAASATYVDIWPGIDLVVTGDEYGSFTEVFIVHSAEAAQNPALRSLRWATQTTNLALTADEAGNLEGRNSGGAVLVTAPAPTMWDSRVAADPVTTANSAGELVDASTGEPVNSTAQSPGSQAAVAAVQVKVDEASLTLVPDSALFSGPDTVFPLYIDPGFTAAKKAASGSSTSWTYVASNYPGTSYWNTKELKVGYEGWDSPYFKARSFITLSVPYSTLSGSSIFSSELQLTETWAGSCTKAQVDLYRTKAISSSTTWNNQPTKLNAVDSVTAAKGWGSNCPSGNLKFDTTALLKTVVNTDKASSVTVGLYADESDRDGWKKFSPKVNTSGDYGSLTTLYNHAPAPPSASSMATSPATACGGGTIVGDASVQLLVTPSDVDHQKLGVGFEVFKNGTRIFFSDDGKTSANYLSAAYSSTTKKYTRVVATVPKATLESGAAGTTQVFTWRARVWDGLTESAIGATCSFTFDAERPGKPDVGEVETNRTVGKVAHFDVTGDGATYQVVLNGVAQPTVKADAAGNVRISVTPTRIENSLTVTPVSAGGNVGTDGDETLFDAEAPAVAADGDLSTDGIPDMSVVGTAVGTPKTGLWTAVGTGSAGAFVTLAKDVGGHGTGLSAKGSAAEFAGSQTVIGHFRGAEVQDVLVYFPTTVTHADKTSTLAGTGVIIPGNADGTLLPQDPESVDTFTRNSITNPDVNSDSPTLVVNGGNITGHPADAEVAAGVVPDLIGIASSDVGAVLEVIPSDGSNAANYQMGQILHAAANSTNLLAPPVSGTSWSAWRIASAQSSNGLELFLWRPGVAGVWRWSGLAYRDNGDGSAVLTIGSSTQVSATLAIAATSTVQAVDVNADAVADLRVVNSAGAATAYLNNSAGTALTAQASQQLSW